jgi:hypothetical protein
MGGQTHDPDSGVGGARQGSTGQVVPLPRDWFGPREELVPVGPSRESEAADAGWDDSSQEASAAAGTANGDQSRQAPLAVDFWGGVAAVEELVPFPASSSGPGNPAGSPAAGRGRTRLYLLGGTARAVAIVRSRVVALPPRRLASAVLVLLVCGVIAARALAPHASGPADVRGPQQLAHRGQSFRTLPSITRTGSLDGRDEPQTFGVRRLASPPRRVVRRRTRPVRARHATASPGITKPTVGQPVVYSPPPTAAPPPTSSATTASSAASESASSGSGASGRSSGGGSEQSGSTKAGPTGPGAPFGPGTLGK